MGEAQEEAQQEEAQETAVEAEKDEEEDSTEDEEADEDDADEDEADEDDADENDSDLILLTDDAQSKRTHNMAFVGAAGLMTFATFFAIARRRGATKESADRAVEM